MNVIPDLTGLDWGEKLMQSRLLQIMPGEYARLGEYVFGIVNFDANASRTILEHFMPRNRPLSRLQVEYLKHIMRQHQFIFTGETVLFSWEMALLNGQHRLLACAETGIPIQVLVMIGLNPAVFDVLDQGKRRSLADVLHLIGEKKTNRLSSIMRRVADFYHSGRVRSGAAMLSMDDYIEFLHNNPDMRESISVTQSSPRTAIIRSEGTAGALHYIFSRYDLRLATEFFNTIYNRVVPTNEPRYSGIVKLIQRLSDNSSKKRDTGDYISALLIKAWNSFVTCRECKHLHWKESEEFPRVFGWEYEKVELGNGHIVQRPARTLNGFMPQKTDLSVAG